MPNNHENINNFLASIPPAELFENRQQLEGLSLGDDPVTVHGHARGDINIFGSRRNVIRFSRSDKTYYNKTRIGPGNVGLIVPAWEGWVVSNNVPNNPKLWIFSAESDDYRPLDCHNLALAMEPWGTGLLVTTHRNLCLVNRHGDVLQQANLTFGQPMRIAAPTIIGDWAFYVEMVEKKPMLKAFSLMTGEAKSVSVELPAYPILDLITDGSRIFVCTPGGDNTMFLQAYDYQALSPCWEYPITLDGPPTTDMVVCSGRLFVASEKGLNSLNCFDGKSQYLYLLEETVTGRLRVIDNIIHATSEKSLFACPFWFGETNWFGTTHIQAAFERPISWLGHNEDRVYLAMDSQVYSVNMVAETRTFDADVDLIADYDISSPNTAKPIARFAVDLHLSNTDNQSPHPHELVRIHTTEEAIIMVNGASYTISKDQPLECRTDLSGSLRLRIDAEDLVAPVLFLETESMNPNFSLEQGNSEFIVISPNSQLNTEMSKLTAEKLQDLNDYDGNPVLLDQYNSNNSANSIASAITGCMTLGRGNRQRDARQGRYLNPSATGHGLFTIEVDGAETIEQVAFPLTTQDNWDLQLNSDSAIYSKVDRDDINRRLADYERWKKPFSPSKVWKQLKDGAIEVKNVLVHQASEGLDTAYALITSVEDEVYSLVINTVENAVTLAQAIVQGVTSGPHGFVEGMSHRWSFETIQMLNDHIQEGMFSGLEYMSDNANSTLGPILEDVETWIQDLQSKADSGFEAAYDYLGQKSISSLSSTGTASDNGESPQTPQDQMHKVRDSWGLGKILDLLDDGNAHGAGLHIPGFTPGSNLLNIINDLIDKLEETFGHEIRLKLEEAGATLSSCGPTGMVTGSAAALLKLLQGVVDGLLQALKGVIDNSVSLIQAALSDFVDFLKTEIPIPWLNEVLGRNARILDLFTFPVSVPLSLAYNAGKKTRGPVDKVEAWILSNTATISFAVYGIFDSIVFTTKVPEVQKTGAQTVRVIMDVAGRVAILGLMAWELQQTKDDESKNRHTLNMLKWFFLCCGNTAEIVKIVWFSYNREAPKNTGRFVCKAIQAGFGVLGVIFVVSEIVAADDFEDFIGTLAVYGIENFMLFFSAILEDYGEEIPWGGPRIVATVGLILRFIEAFVVYLVGFSDLIGDKGDARQSRSLLLEYLLPPGSAPNFSFKTSGDVEANTLRYAVSFFDRANETPRSPWSGEANYDNGGTVEVSDIPLDTSGLGLGRRIYRFMNDSGVRLVGQLDDNTTTTFEDDLSEA